MISNYKHIFVSASAFIIFFFLSNINAQDLKPEDKYMLASGLEQNGDLEKAKNLFLELLNLKPSDYNYFTSLNRVYLKLKDYDSSIKMIEGRIKENPADYNFWGLLGNTYYVKGDIDKAYGVWDNCLSANSKNIVPYRVICSYAVQNRAYEKAIEYYKKGETELNKKGLFLNEMFNLYSVLNKNKEAVESLCEALLVQPELISMGKSVFYSLTSKSEISDEYAELVKDYVAKTGRNVFKELLAFVYQLKGENIKAFVLIKEIDSGEKNGNAVYNFAQECFGYKNYEAASVSFKYIVDNYIKAPFYLQSVIYYPKALELSIKKAEKEKWKMEAFPDTTNRAEYYKVISAYEETAKIIPNSENRNEAFLRIGLIQKEILRQYAQAEKQFEKIITSGVYSATRVGAIQNLSELKMINGNFNEAEKLLNELLKTSITDSLAVKKAYFTLGKCCFWRGMFNEAVSNLDEAAYDFANDLSNDALELSALINSCRNDSLLLSDFAMADWLISAGKFEKGAELLKKTAKSDNIILAEASKYRYAGILTALNKYPEAIKILEEISASDNSIYADNAYFSLGNVYFYGIMNFRGAKSCFEKLLAAYPGSIFADKAREMINIIKNKLENKNDNRPDKY